MRGMGDEQIHRVPMSAPSGNMPRARQPPVTYDRKVPPAFAIRRCQPHLGSPGESAVDPAIAPAQNGAAAAKR